MNGLGVYATPVTKKDGDRCSANTVAGFRMWMLKRSIVGKTPSQTDLADKAIDVAIMMTNDRPSRLRLDPSTHHSMRGRIRRLLRSTGLVVALSSFLPLPMPVTGFVFDPAAYADPYTGAIPKWIRSACCGPADVHRLAVGQVREVEAAEALRLRPNANKDVVKQRDTYYVIDDYDFPLNSNLRALTRTACRAVINTSGRSTERAIRRRE
jgi:hypothetical protein